MRWTHLLGAPLCGAALATPSLAQAIPGPSASNTPKVARTAPYRVLDTIEGEWIDLAAAPIRPLARAADGRLLAVGNHDSSLRVLAADGTLLAKVRMPWRPVSVAHVPAAGGAPERALVACRSSYELVVVDLAAARIETLVGLETEPADLLVHPTSGHAFVSCSGANAVLEVDVDAGRVVGRYAIDGHAPTFLSLDGSSVLVAPLLSGNNSMADTGNLVLDTGPGRVLDLEDPTVALQALPDHDLFRITPGGGVQPVATDMGTILFAQGVNPQTGELWQLGTEANNKDPMRMGEPAIRGEISFDRLTIATLGAGVVPPSAVIELDDSDPGTPGIQYDRTRTVGQPYALAFDGAGDGYLTGLLSDNVTQLDSAGGFLREWDTGSIPRGLVVDTGGTRAWVYCWGDNTVEEWNLAPATPQLVRTTSLGFDPTPALEAEGRRLYFSGEFSEHGNASCNTCHVEGDIDLLAWDLSNLPRDDKGPLVTQTLRGISDTRPFHWRGERDELVDFNGAFDGLLGGVELDTAPGSEFDAFEAFVFSLEQPAHPGQDRSRRLVDRGEFTTPDGVVHQADAIRGQDLYFDGPAIIGFGSCNTCHTLPTGTNHEVVLDEPDLEVPRRNHFVVAPINGVWRKEAPSVHDVVLANGTTESRPTIGSGVSATGLKDSMLDFVQIDLFDFDPQQDRDVAAFMMQLDSGLAPAVHEAWWLDAAASVHTRRDLAGFALRQATARHIDLVATGEVELGGQARELGWLFDRASGLFVPSDSSVAPRALSFFLDQAQAGTGELLFVGLPVGMGAGFAVDFDRDGFLNDDELSAGTDPFDADSDDDGDPDGHEVNEGGDPLDGGVQSSDTTAPTMSNLRVTWVTTRAAKVQFDTDEPVRWDVIWTAGGASGSLASDRFRTNHTLLFGDLKPGRVHDLTLTLTDLGGQTFVQSFPAGITTNDIEFPQDVLLRNPSVTVLQNSGGTLRYQITGKAGFKGGGNAIGFQLRSQVIVNGVLQPGLVTGTTSGGNGLTSIVIEANGLSVGDVVTASIFSLHLVSQNTSAFWNMPSTNPDNREFDLSYDGTGP